LGLKYLVNVVGLLRSNSYVVYDESTREAVIIDAGDDAWKIVEAVQRNRLKPSAIYATHCHFDHVMAVEDLKQAFNIPFYIHRADEEILMLNKEMTRQLLGIEIPDPPKVDGYVEEGMEIVIGNGRLKVLHTPGHSPGSVCYHTDSLLFSGDTLFQGSVGRTDAPGGSAEQLTHSIVEKLFKLPDDVEVLPGHGPSTTIGWEKRSNPFVEKTVYLDAGFMSLEELHRRIVACRLCPRLVKYRQRAAEKRPLRFRNETYWARPLPGFGDPAARLLVIGLAPAAHGGNRTGRMFTGDSSGNTLMRSLHRAGFANLDRSERADDGLVLTDAYLTAVVRCPPPENKPSKTEINNCIIYLKAELRLLQNIKVVVTLGRIAFQTYLSLVRSEGLLKKPLPEFRHGAVYRLEGMLYGRPLPVLIASYHPSRQNTNTGRLTQKMLDWVFLDARRFVG
jgi:uracil-DNA glycosylase family 4